LHVSVGFVNIILFMYCCFVFCKELIQHILDMSYLSYRTSEFCVVGKCVTYYHSRFYILASMVRYYWSQIENNTIL